MGNNTLFVSTLALALITGCDASPPDGAGGGGSTSSSTGSDVGCPPPPVTDFPPLPPDCDGLFFAFGGEDVHMGSIMANGGGNQPWLVSTEIQPAADVHAAFACIPSPWYPGGGTFAWVSAKVDAEEDPNFHLRIFKGWDGVKGGGQLIQHAFYTCMDHSPTSSQEVADVVNGGSQAINISGDARTPMLSVSKFNYDIVSVGTHCFTGQYALVVLAAYPVQ